MRLVSVLSAAGHATVDLVVAAVTRATSISLVKETRPGEYRVLLLPDVVRSLREAGLTVFVEYGAGDGARVPDGEYAAAGATLTDTEGAWSKSDFIVKYKAPTAEEYRSSGPDGASGPISTPRASRRWSQRCARTR